MRRFSPGLLLFALTVSISAPALADDADVGAPAVDGFYLRAGVGPSFQRDQIEVGAPEGEVAGSGVALELAGGWAVSRQLLIGAALEYDIGFDPDVEVGEAMLEQDTALLVTVGPFASWYFSGDRTWYASAGLGLAISTSPTPAGTDDGGAFGFGAFASIGREWRVSPGWAVGGTLRAQYARATDYDPIGDIFGSDKAAHQVVGLAAMLAASYD